MNDDKLTLIGQKRLIELLTVEQEVKALREVEKAARGVFKYFEPNDVYYGDKSIERLKFAVNKLDEARRK